ncbi:autotransporter-associated beta strand protein [Streptacidiphilus sp. MAP12-20]|uniref:phosphatase PAP2 family protein n=1 Tax=Streptacidiphilus sp. MAP12-20 TaxID=3156299 RepID=UPI0035192EE4
MRASRTVSRRAVLGSAIGVTAGLALPAPLAVASSTTPRSAAASSTDAMLPFVEHYTTNTSANLTAATNAAVDALSGMARAWQTGSVWNNGTVIDRQLLRANMRHCVETTARRTAEQAKQAFIHDRQDQSYGVIDGLGPLAELYKAGALAVTSITAAPDGTPPGPVNEGVPAGAPAGSATGAGSTASQLGAVVALVQTLRGTYSSGNPSKLAYRYPRPWRMTEDSEVVDTGATDAFGFPVYRSEVIVAPQLLRQRSATPATDGGYPSGHTNAFFLAALALAHAVPERFQELVTRAFELADSRIVAGMHSPVDVLGGRTLATALAAAILSDPANAGIKTAARNTASAYFQAVTGTTADTLYAFAHGADSADSADSSTDPYADRRVNAATVAPLLTYGLPRRGERREMTVPQGAEVLLETRLPYLSADQRREVLRTTALPSGHPILEGPEQWGRLNLFAAADAYAAFDEDVRVTMAASAQGFHAADSWRNDIAGPGGLTKRGTGTLTLAGANRYRGGTQVREGVLVAASREALGRGDVLVQGGTLRLAADSGVRVHGSLTLAGGSLEAADGDAHDGAPALDAAGCVRLGWDSDLTIHLSSAAASGHTRSLHLISADGLTGRFRSISVDVPGYRLQPRYTGTGLHLKLTAAH